MSLELKICPFLPLAMPSSLLFPGRPQERYGSREPMPHACTRRVRGARHGALPSARVHREIVR